MRLERTEEWVTKIAESEEERIRLGREAGILRAVAHPGVVRVAGVEGPLAPERPDRLRLHRVDGPTLADVETPPGPVAAGWGAAVATVVADLHDLGYIHGAVIPEHILIDGPGRPILCGFGRAGRVHEAGQAAMDEDVRAVARLVGRLLGPGHDRVRRSVQGWDSTRRRHRSGARALARTLVEKVPEATVVPDAGPQVGADATPPFRRRRLFLGTAGLAAAFGCGLLVANVSHTTPEPSTPGSSTGYVMRSGPGVHPITVVGRWGCGASRPAVLDTASGSIWTYPAWPAPGGTVTGRFVAQVAGASGLAAVSGSHGCDDLMVVRAGRPDLRLALGPSA